MDLRVGLLHIPVEEVQWECANKRVEEGKVTFWSRRFMKRTDDGTDLIPTLLFGSNTAATLFGSTKEVLFPTYFEAMQSTPNSFYDFAIPTPCTKRHKDLAAWWAHDGLWRGMKKQPLLNTVASLARWGECPDCPEYRWALGLTTEAVEFAKGILNGWAYAEGPTSAIVVNVRNKSVLLQANDEWALTELEPLIACALETHFEPRVTTVMYNYGPAIPMPAPLMLQ